MERFWFQEASDASCPGRYEVPKDFQIELHEFGCTGSTNAVLMDMARSGAPVGTVVWAHRQDGGRGRLGRSFSSPEGGVYISMLVPCPKELNEIGFALTAKAGVAVRRTIWDVCGIECGIKWVNDIILNGRKVCGILAQMVAREGGDVVVVGIGVNYATPLSSFSDDLRGVVGSLYDADAVDAKDVPPMRDFVMALVANVYGLVCGRECSTKWLCEYKSSSTILGNEVKVIQAGLVVAVGRAVLIDDDCHLHVMCDEPCDKSCVKLGNAGHGGSQRVRELVLSTGEVSVRDKEV